MRPGGASGDGATTGILEQARSLSFGRRTLSLSLAHPYYINNTHTHLSAPELQLQLQRPTSTPSRRVDRLHLRSHLCSLALPPTLKPLARTHRHRCAMYTSASSMNMFTRNIGPAYVSLYHLNPARWQGGPSADRRAPSAVSAPYRTAGSAFFASCHSQRLGMGWHAHES